MRILLAGASGFLGGKLRQRLAGSGHELVQLVRRKPAAAGELRWDPAAGTVDPTALSDVDAVVNLAGANLAGRRWTDAYKRVVLASRVDSTGTLARAIAARPAGNRPRTLLNGSAVGFYGDTGDRGVDETALPGDDFLADLCVEWENAAAPATDAGARVAWLRTGFPMSRDGGLLQPLILPFRLGLGGRFGNGRQYLPWISLADWLSAVEFLLARDDVAGPVNLTGPAPVRNAEFAKTLARHLHRPALIPLPRLALRVGIGEFGPDVLKSSRVLPAVLTDNGYRFAHPTLDAALADGLRG